jgi:hypothetical protein
MLTNQGYTGAVSDLAHSQDNSSMAFFDRYDICEAHYLLESDYNVGGILKERPSNERRMMSSGFQLSRMGFTPSPFLTFDTLSENGMIIYNELVQRYQLPEA